MRGPVLLTDAELPGLEPLEAFFTRVHGAPVGDVTFPDVDWKAWRTVNSQSYPSGPKDEYAFTFSVLERG